MSGRAGLEPTTGGSSDCGRRPLFLALLFVGVVGALAACSLVAVLDGLAAFMGGTLHRREPERGRAAWQRGDGDRQDICCQQLAEKGWSNRAVERQGTGEFIGFIGLSVPRWRLPFSPCGKNRLVPEAIGLAPRLRHGRSQGVSASRGHAARARRDRVVHDHDESALSGSKQSHLRCIRPTSPARRRPSARPRRPFWTKPLNRPWPAPRAPSRAGAPSVPPLTRPGSPGSNCDESTWAPFEAVRREHPGVSSPRAARTQAGSSRRERRSPGSAPTGPTVWMQKANTLGLHQLHANSA